MNWFFVKKKKINPLSKSRAPMTRKEKLLKLAQSDSYYSVSIISCSCKASSKLIGQCFQFNDAPSLPLADCNAAKCTCEYLGMINRRRVQRRSTKVRRKSVRRGSERRNMGRRKEEDKVEIRHEKIFEAMKREKVRKRKAIISKQKKEKREFLEEVKSRSLEENIKLLDIKYNSLSSKERMASYGEYKESISWLKSKYKADK